MFHHELCGCVPRCSIANSAYITDVNRNYGVCFLSRAIDMTATIGWAKQNQETLRWFTFLSVNQCSTARWQELSQTTSPRRWDIPANILETWAPVSFLGFVCDPLTWYTGRQNHCSGRYIVLRKPEKWLTHAGWFITGAVPGWRAAVGDRWRNVYHHVWDTQCVSFEKR